MYRDFERVKAISRKWYFFLRTPLMKSTVKRIQMKYVNYEVHTVGTPDIVISNLFLKWLDVINFFKFCKNQINRNISFKYGIYFVYFQTNYNKLCNRHTKYGDIFKFEKEICRYVFYFFYQIIFFENIRINIFIKYLLYTTRYLFETN